MNRTPLEGECGYVCECPDGGEPRVHFTTDQIFSKCKQQGAARSCPIAVTVERLWPVSPLGFNEYNLVACGPLSRQTL